MQVCKEQAPNVVSLGCFLFSLLPMHPQGPPPVVLALPSSSLSSWESCLHGCTWAVVLLGSVPSVWPTVAEFELVFVTVAFREWY